MSAATRRRFILIATSFPALSSNMASLPQSHMVKEPSPIFLALGPVSDGDTRSDGGKFGIALQGDASSLLSYVSSRNSCGTPGFATIATSAHRKIILPLTRNREKGACILLHEEKPDSVGSFRNVAVMEHYSASLNMHEWLRACFSSLRFFSFFLPSFPAD